MQSIVSSLHEAITCRTILKEMGWLKKQSQADEKQMMLAIADETHDMTDNTYNAFLKAKAATDMSLKSAKARREYCKFLCRVFRRVKATTAMCDKSTVHTVLESLRIISNRLARKGVWAKAKDMKKTARMNDDLEKLKKGISLVQSRVHVVNEASM